MMSESQIGRVSIFISNRIIITGLNEKEKAVFKKTLTLTNPAHYRMVRSGNTRAAFSIPKEFIYYYENGEQLHIPRGMKKRLLAFCKKYDIKYTLKEDLIEKKSNIISTKDIKLRDYQSSIVDKIIEDGSTEGIVNASTGSGKTIMMLELIHRLGVTATILVPNTLLLRQVEAEAKKFYNMTISIIGDGSKDISQVTVSTFQSLFKNPKILQELSDNTSMLMVDECHGVVSDEREKVIKQFRPKYLFGFSATIDREDGKAEAIKFMMGNVIAKHEATMLNPIVELWYSNTNIPTDDYHEMVKVMTEDRSRNMLISGMTIGELLEGRKILILTKRVEHAKTIYNLLPDSDAKFLIASDDKERHDTLALLKSGLADFNCIVGTTALLSQGFDLPQLDTLVIACDMKSGILTQQSVGRVLRLFNKKGQPKIIDIVDNKNPFFNRQAKARQSIYRRCGWEIKDQYDF